MSATRRTYFYGHSLICDERCIEQVRLKGVHKVNIASFDNRYLAAVGMYWLGVKNET